MPSLGEASRQATYSKPVEAAFDDMCRALELIGTIKKADKSSLTIAGTTRYGLQVVHLRVAIALVDGASSITVQAFSDDVSSTGAKKGAERLLETLRNLDNPDYKPSKTGLSTTSVVLRLTGFMALVLVLLTLWATMPGPVMRAVLVFGGAAVIVLLIGRWRWRRGR